MVKSKWIKKAKSTRYMYKGTYIYNISHNCYDSYIEIISGSFGYDEMTLIKNNLIGLTFYWIRKLHQVPSLQIPRIVY